MNSTPWYKRKLPSKYFQERITNKERFSDALNAQRWRFLKSGLDDFRNGCPPSSDNIIIRGKRGPIPIIVQYKNTDHSQIVPYKTREQQNKSKVICSKLSAAQKTKKDFIAQTERYLNQHPLALYPHLEESMPKELFRDVMRLLYPEMHLTRDSSDESKNEVNIPVQHELHCETPPEISYSPPVLPWLPKKKNPYTWFSKQEVAERERAAKIAYVPPLDENVKRVTKEFCEWVSAMGGEKYNIDEATVMKLFDTSYETTAKSVAPIKIVELYHVPPELRECPEGIPCRKSIQSPDMRTASEPKWEKIKYGAWYLHPKKWKKKRVGEQDEIPESLKAFLKLRKKKAQKGEGEEMPLHGTYAFEKFLDAKGYRKPADRAVPISKSSGNLTEKVQTHKTKKSREKNAEKEKATSSSAEPMKKLHEDKIKQLKKSFFLPPVSLKKDFFYLPYI